MIEDDVLNAIADAISANASSLLEANKEDLKRMDPKNPLYDRLLLTSKRLEGISDSLRIIAKLPTPLGKVLEKKILPNGLELTKVTVPLGTVGVIYESRPNVTFDVFALCFKSGNRCVLKGGAEAKHSNEAIVQFIHSFLEQYDISKDRVELLSPDRASVKKLLEATDWVDVIIPRGSHELIQYVREHSRVPVIETGAGIVHTYVDQTFDLNTAKRIIQNAKTRRVSVCNALDTLLIHQAALPHLFTLVEPLIASKVELFADQDAYQMLKKHYPDHLLRPAKEEDFGKEFLDYKMSVKTVKNLSEALSHIQEHGSKHSEAIISKDTETIEQFLKAVDAAVVYANASTAFTDGGEFGLGGEIGISTQKLHARGPMGLNELTSYKQVVKGSGQIRN